jgi:hypothetical protein
MLDLQKAIQARAGSVTAGSQTGTVEIAIKGLSKAGS